MSKLITREAFKVALQAIKDFVEKKLKAFSFDVHNIVNTEIESATKELATKSELDSKLDQDSSAQNDHVAIFKQTDAGVNLLDSGYVIGNNDLGNVKVAYPVIGTGSYGSTANYVYGYADTDNLIGGQPGDSSTDVQTLVYSDITLTQPIGRTIYGAPYTLCHFNTPGDITSGYNHTRDITGITSDYDNPIIIERVIENNTIATEKGVEEYVTTTIVPEIDSVKDTLLKTIHVENSSTISIEGNTRVILDTPVSSSITFDFDASEKEIIIMFTAGENCSCSFTQPIAWQNDNVPTWEAGKTYEISIFNNLAVYTSYVV